MKTVLTNGLWGLAGLFLVFILIYLFVFPPRTPRQSAGFAAFEVHAGALVEKNNPPGLSVVVLQDGERVYAQGFGTQDGETPTSPETVYHWWSMTKVATAVAILQLADQGQIDLDAPLTTYLPDMELVYPEDSSDPVTVRHLLSHTSGLGDYLPALLGWVHFEDEIYDQTALLNEYLPEYNQLKSAPGTEAAYTNLGYHMLGAVIEAVTGMSYEEYVVLNVLAPLEMTGTDFLYKPDQAAYEARGSQPFFDMYTPLLPFMFDTKALLGSRTGASWWMNRVYIDVTPSTGLIGSAAEAALLGNALMADGVYGGFGAQMQPGDEQPLGRPLGWAEYSEGERLWLQHRGGGPGFATIMRIYPEENLVIVLMANGTALDREGLVDLLADLSWRES